LPVVVLASAAAIAAGGLLACSLRGKRRTSLSGQVCLGLLAGCAAAVIWNRRREEASAARHLMAQIHDVCDARWLKKHPIAYG
jgi:hypothetical protein